MSFSVLEWQRPGWALCDKKQWDFDPFKNPVWVMHTEQLLPMDAACLDVVFQLTCYGLSAGCLPPGVLRYWPRAGDTSTGFLSQADAPGGSVREFPDDRNIPKKQFQTVLFKN